MRLTLRTLLAWLDGVLSGADQQELGEKVSASPIAPRLVERIRDVMARPGLAAPRPDGRGLADDANTVAEFLDNALPADRLEAFERVCIDSDLHLAEAADCHAILAEMARDPALIPPLERGLRQRLRDQVRSQARDEAADTMPVLERAGAAKQPVGRGAVVGRPPAGRRASWAAWVSAGVAILLLLALAGLLVRSLVIPAVRGRDVAARGQPAPIVEPAQPAEQDGVANTLTMPDASLPSPAPPAAAAEIAPAATVREPPPDASPAAPVDVATEVRPANEPARPVPPPPRPNPPPSVPLPAMELAAEDPVVGLPPPMAAAAVPAAPGAVAEGGALLHRVGEGAAARWEPLAPGDPLAAVEELVVPAHAYPRLMRGDLSIRLQPNTLAALVTDTDGTPRLEVVFGKAVVWTEAADATLGVAAGGLSGVIAIGPRQTVGVLVELVRNPGDDPAVVPPGRRATLYASGGASWRQTEIDGGPPEQLLVGLAIEQPLPPRSELTWTSAEPEAARILSASSPPAWLERKQAGSRPDQSAAAELAKRLGADARVDETLRTMATDQRAENRMAAAATAALLGNYEPAVELLCEASSDRRLRDGQWAELEAQTVQQALARGANAAATLRQAFAARGPAGRADDLYLLARGLSPAERDAGGAAALVSSLNDEEPLIVRRYASRTLLELFPDDPAARVEYRADRPPGLNDKAIDWWQRKVAGAAAAPPP